MNGTIQEQMFWEEHDRIAAADVTFQEMLKSGNPITKKELRELIKKRPSVWGRYSAYLETDVLPEE